MVYSLFMSIEEARKKVSEVMEEKVHTGFGKTHLRVERVHSVLCLGFIQDWDL